MTKEELIEHATAIKNFCMERNNCTNCPFSYDVGIGCELTDSVNYPAQWDLPEKIIAKVDEEYQYAVFDYTGEKCSAAFSDLEMAERVKDLLYMFSCNEGRTLIIKKRLVMEWEPMKDKEDEELRSCEGE